MKSYTILKPFLLLFFVLFCNDLLAQSTLQDAWQAFFTNNRANARTLFTGAADQQGSKGEALLGLSLLAQMDKPSTEAFDYFKKFYAQSKDPQPYIFALWTTPSINESFGKKSADQLAFLRLLTQQKDYDGTITAMAYSMLGNHYQSIKKPLLADKEFANVGSLDNWAITGEFQNISTSGFDKSYETLTHPDDNATFKNKNGVNFAWHTVPYIRHDKWFDFTYYTDADDAIEFAQSFIRSDSEQEVQLRVGVSGSLKVWVNDQLILSEADERNNDIDTYIRSIKLHAGNNRILVQVGESYAGRSNFLLRLTNKNGHALSNITSSAKYQPYTKEDKYGSKASELYAIEYFKQQINKNPDDYLSQLMLAQAYLLIDKTFEARNIIDPLLKKYPGSTFLNSMLIDLFEKTKNRTGEETIKETIKMADPESLLALFLKYNELVEQKDYTKAGEIINKIEQQYPFRDEYVIGARLDLADNNNNQSDVIKLADQAYAKYPENRNFAKYKFLIETNLKKDAAKGIDILKKYVDNNDNYAMAEDLAGAYFNIGKAAAGFKVYTDEIVLAPIGVGMYSTLGELYYKQQLYNKAEEQFLSCLTIAPTVGSYYKWLAKIYEATQQKAKAIQFYQKGLELDPTDYESIRALRKLQGKNEVFTYFKQPDIESLVKNAPKVADYPDDNYAILDQDIQRVVYENGGSEDKRFVLIKVFNQKGIEALKEYTVDVENEQSYNIELAEVIKANGTKVPAEKSQNNLVFTNLEIGDIINIRYKTENYYKGSLASHFGDSFYFSRGCPSINLTYSLLINKQKPFSYKFSGTSIAPEKKSVDEFDLYIWKAANVKSIKAEDKMPAFDDVANILYLTSIPDWKFISNWYNDIATAKARTNYEVKAVINDIFKEQNNLSDMQKVEKIYKYITGTISYSSVSFRQSGIVPQNPADVINTRIGDCKDVSTLFVAMCKEAGIKAQLVLVKTRRYGLNTMVLPNIDFNHCIAKVHLNNQDYYIELTAKYLPFRSIYRQSVNSSILDIGNGNGVSQINYLDPANRNPNNINRVSNVTFRDNDILISQNTYETAAMAGILRTFYTDLSPADRVKKTKEGFSSIYPDNEINELTFKGMDNPMTDTVFLNLKYEIRNTVKQIAGLSIFSLPWSDKFSASIFQITSPRYTGIDVSQLFSVDNETETITIDLPAKKTIIEPPLPVNLASDIMDYTITPTVKNNKLTLTRTIRLKKDFIPAEKVPEFNSFLKKVIEADNKEFAMK
jgi:hypothetical protein